MRKLNYLVLLLLIIGCSAQHTISKEKKYKKGIVYVLPDAVVKRLSLLDIKNNDNSYFSLETIGALQFRIYFDHFQENDNWVKNTNRYISIGNKLYPLTFDLDMYFANKETAEEFLKNQKQEIYLRSQRTIIRDYIYHIDFTFKGEIVYEGY